MNALQDRAIKIYSLSHGQPTIKAAVDLIEQELRTTRDEGIETGFGQATRHEDILERRTA